MYVYNLPWAVRDDLVTLLNQDRTWERLAGTCMGYGHIDIARFQERVHKSGTSPADALLTDWGQKNHTVDELYRFLHQLGESACQKQHHRICNRGVVPIYRPVSDDERDSSSSL